MMKIGTLGEIFKKAYQEAGIDLPSPPARTVHISANGKRKPGKPAHTSSDSRAYQPRSKARKQTSVGETRTKPLTRRAVQTEKPMMPKPSRAQDLSSPVATKVVQTPEYRLSVDKDCVLTWPPVYDDPCRLLTDYVSSGRALQFAESTDEDAELTIGLDFGTSSVKAVITDKAKNVSYAVPFREGSGVGKYLLPCTLNKGEQVIHDLKMALLSDPDSDQCQENVVEFLAQVIRHVRGWLFTTHGKVYERSYVLWGLSIGLPVASMQEQRVATIYKILGYAAWLAAGSGEEALSSETIRHSLERAKQVNPDSDEAIDEAGVEIKLAPEVAAQIHGFVSSGAYDPHGQNIYLMVDIGAGTLDASVFRIVRRDGRDEFINYTSTVEPNGTMCLHRRRMQWLYQALESQVPEREDLREGVQRIGLLTDTELPLPENLKGYFSHIDLKFSDQKKNPDRIFYGNVYAQVGNRTYARLAEKHLPDEGLAEGNMAESVLKKKKKLPAHQMKDMPMIICGGGKRLAFYAELEKSMASSPGYSWFSTRLFKLKRPEQLIAPGLKESEYDRLSVAYGLSRINLKAIIMDVPLMEDEGLKINWRDLYIDN